MFKNAVFLVIGLLLLPKLTFSQKPDNEAIDSLSIKLIYALKDDDPQSLEDHFMTRKDLISLSGLDEKDLQEEKIKSFPLKIRKQWNLNFKFVVQGLKNYTNNWDTLKYLGAEIDHDDIYIKLTDSFSLTITDVLANCIIDNSKVKIAYHCVKTTRGWLLLDYLKIKEANQGVPLVDLLPKEKYNQQVDSISEIMVKVFQQDDPSLIDPFMIKADDMVYFRKKTSENPEAEISKEDYDKINSFVQMQRKVWLESFSDIKKKCSEVSINLSQIKYQSSIVEYKVDQPTKVVNTKVKAIFRFKEELYYLEYEAIRMENSWVVGGNVKIYPYTEKK